MADRIADLSERRRRLWAQPWESWQRDMEARINFLTKLLQEEYAEKRKQRAGADNSGLSGLRPPR